jgi:hypothetical protein
MNISTSAAEIATPCGSPRVLRGWKDIANHLEVTDRAARERATRPFDPLPVFYDHRGPFAFVDALDQWVARSVFAYKSHLRLNQLEAAERRRAQASVERRDEHDASETEAFCASSRRRCGNLR